MLLNPYAPVMFKFIIKVLNLRPSCETAGWVPVTGMTSGTMHGLMRVRGFTQDDGHIFCTEDQIEVKRLTSYHCCPRFILSLASNPLI